MNKNFLSKKSWHTGSIKHMEKVWKAEQRDTDEKKKMELLKRELAEEQRRFELRQMAEVATGKPVIEKVDWMYAVKKGPSTEEYLTGTAVRQQEEERELEQLAKKPGALWLHQTNPQQDAAAKVRDDPLLAIKMQEQKSLKKILDNPMQMKKIKESKDVKKMLKRLKKLKKKEKKGSSGSESSSGEESKGKKRSRSRSKSPKKNRRSLSPQKKERRREASTERSKEEKRRDLSHDRTKPKDERSHRSVYHNDDRTNYKRDSHGNGASHREDSSNRNHKPRLTKEEREKLIKEMQQDADTHEEYRWKRIKKESEQEKKDGNIDGSQNKHGKFLDDMNRGIYLGSKETLSDRISSHIHNVERKTGSALIHEEGGLV